MIDMMGKPQRREARLFHIGFDLDERIGADHPLRRIDQAVDFSFVRPIVAGLYGYNGQESLDPTLVLKLMFLCFYENVRSERELMRKLPCRLDWLWFCGMDLDDAAPDHSVLSKARRRWGEETFEHLFAHVLDLCRQAKLLDGSTVHADSTLLKADASLEGRVSRVLWEQLEQAADPTVPPRQMAVDPSGSDDSDGQGRGDDDAPVQEASSSAKAPAADDALDGASSLKTAGSTTTPTPPSLPPAGSFAARRPKKLNEWLVSPVDPDAATTTRKKGGTTLGYRDHRLVDDKHGLILSTVATPADTDDGSMLSELLVRQEQYTRTTPREVVGDSMYGTKENYEQLGRRKIKAYLKKRRGKDSPRVSWVKLLPQGCTPGRARRLLARRKAVAEGSFAEAHVRMNHRRCRWRRQWRVQIQCYLMATLQNVKKLIRRGPGRRRSRSFFQFSPRCPLPM
jgi:transposase